MFRDEKPGCFARFKRGKRGANDQENGNVSKVQAQQVDPRSFPEVKSRKSTLPPLQPTKVKLRLA